jgi:hypothetical protein
MAERSADAVLAAVERLRQRTEDKIAATLARDSRRLQSLLEEELPDLMAIRGQLAHAAEWTAKDRERLKAAVSLWQARAEYLQTLLETQLGYLAFVREVLGLGETPTRVDQAF